MKKQNKKHQNARFINEKLNTKSLMCIVSFYSCDLQDFKFQYVNHKAFGHKEYSQKTFILAFCLTLSLSSITLLFQKCSIKNLQKNELRLK